MHESIFHIPADMRPGSLEEARNILGDCQRCRLCETRKNIVFGIGDPHADLVVIGEAPGAKEDHHGEPFVGKAGNMLDNMLDKVLDLGRDEVYILNTLKCRPPENRSPARDEIDSCLPFLQMQVEIVQPKLILLMGSVALKALFNVNHGVTRVRGEWMVWNNIEVMPTFHPSYLLRSVGSRDEEVRKQGLEDKVKVFHDLQDLRCRYDELYGKRS